MQVQCKQQLKCDFCDQTFSTLNNKSKHQRYCESNPSSTLNGSTTPNTTTVNNHTTSPLNNSNGLLATTFNNSGLKLNQNTNGNSDLTDILDRKSVV